jgi:branched-subunit amino acid aminotransferase/4-amino-4-deoxychorismate lyase
MSERNAQSELVSSLCGRDARAMNQPAKRDLEEVMEFDPEEGILDLETHLDRLKAQADQLGYEFDRHSARNELQAATFGKRSRGKARLLVSPTGAMAIELKRG